MTIKKILLTGDDGYSAIGIRLLVRALKDKYQLQIAATKHQQSGVGGKLSLETGGNWGEAEVDGVPVFWVEGSPADVMECVESYYAQTFDLVISGVNLGANVTSSVISSGTYNAAFRAVGLHVAPKAIAISWDAPPDMWRKKHDANENISEHFSYPGNVLAPLIEKCLSAEMWGVDMLNINLPKQPTEQIVFTKILKDIRRYYASPMIVDRETHRFSYPTNAPANVGTQIRYDAAALSQGFISITPCSIDMTHFQTFESLEHTPISLNPKK